MRPLTIAGPRGVAASNTSGPSRIVAFIRSGSIVSATLGRTFAMLS